MRHLELSRLTLDMRDLAIHRLAALQGPQGGGSGRGGSAGVNREGGQGPPWVLLGKHLCGAATDFGWVEWALAHALRLILNQCFWCVMCGCNFVGELHAASLIGIWGSGVSISMFDVCCIMWLCFTGRWLLNMFFMFHFMFSILMWGGKSHNRCKLPSNLSIQHTSFTLHINQPILLPLHTCVAAGCVLVCGAWLS